MADRHNDNIPALGNQIASDIPDIKENLEWHKDILQMLIGWHNSTIGSLSPPGPQRSKFSWKDADEIYIGPGVYFHDGTTRQTVFWDATITFKLGSGGSNALSDDLTASAWQYIYIDDSAVVTQASQELDADCFLNDTTAPTWSDSKHGWYNGSDRCIFAVITSAASILYEFHNDGGDLVRFLPHDAAAEAAPGNYASRDEKTLTLPGFCTKAQGRFRTTYVSSEDFAYVQPKSYAESIGLVQVGFVNVAGTNDCVNTPVFTDSSQIIEVWTTNGDAKMKITTEGWYFPTGM